MALTTDERSDLIMMYMATFDRAPDADGLNFWAGQMDQQGATLLDVSRSMFASDEAEEVYPEYLTNNELVNQVYQNLLDRQPDSQGETYWTSQLDNGVIERAEFVKAVIDGTEGPNADPADKQLVDAKTEVAEYFAVEKGLNDTDKAQSILDDVEAGTSVADAKADLDSFASGGQTLNLTAESAAGADAMRLTGDQDVRIDFTDPDNQITGLDLDGNGTIARDGQENTIDDGDVVPSGEEPADGAFEIVDAAPRNPANANDIANNFTGDIDFDGTGFGGDGTNTDGNIVLGGLGADTIRGGIGNDFLSGGGIAGNSQDELSGGRNADFFFSSLSQLSPTNGDNLVIDGGSTADDTAAGRGLSGQDTDWVMLEASDDDEPVTADLSDAHPGAPAGTGEQDQLISTRSGVSVDMDEVENIDASGNLYGFLDDVNTQIGEGAGDDRVSNANQAIGATAQLEIDGSQAANILIGGFDNDHISGNGGADLLMGGNLGQNNNPNAQGIVNDGQDVLEGDDGDDNLVWEADGGVYQGGSGEDNLWLTDQSMGTQSAADLTSDDTVRMDLGDARFDGYGADRDGTADQSRYNPADATTVTGMANINASGLGAVDFEAAGTNDPDLAFANQQNFDGTEEALSLRGQDQQGGPTIWDPYVEGDERLFIPPDGTLPQASQGPVIQTGVDATVNYDITASNGAPTADFLDALDRAGGSQHVPDQFQNELIAGAGDDLLEGRGGTDRLSGRLGADDFVVNLGANEAQGADGYLTGAVGEDGRFPAEYLVRGVGDGVNFINRDIDAENTDGTTGADGLFDPATTGDHIGQDFRPNLVTDPGQTVVSLDPTGAFDNPGGPDDWSDFNGVTLFYTNQQPVQVTSQAIAGASTNQDVANALTAALTNQGLTDFSASAQGDDRVQVTAPASANVDNVSAVFEPPQGVDAGFQARVSTGGETQIPEDDELIFRSYENRSDNELTQDHQYGLGPTSYAEDLVHSFEGGNTNLVEGQAYRIDLSGVKDPDTVSVTINGQTFTEQVDVDSVDYDADSATTSQVVQELAAQIRGAINEDDDSLMANLGVDVIDGSGDDAALRIYEVDGAQDTFLRAPEVSIQDSSGGVDPTYSVEDLSNTRVSLTDFADDLNTGRDHTAQSGDQVGDRFVTFEGESGINRSILQTAAEDDVGETPDPNNTSDNSVSQAGDQPLQGMDVAAYDAPDGDQQELTITGPFGGTAQQDFSFGDSPDHPDGVYLRDITDETFNAPDSGGTVVDVGDSQYFAVHGNDFLIGGDSDDVIQAGTGGDKVLASPSATTSTDVVDGGQDLVIANADGEIQFDANGNPVQVAGSGETHVGFHDRLVLDERQFGGTASFEIVIGALAAAEAADGSLNGTVNADQGNDGSTDDVTEFSNFETVRSLSNTRNDTLDVEALSDDLAGNAAPFDNGVNFNAGSGVLTINADGNANANGPSANEIEAEVLGMENIIGGAGEDDLTGDAQANHIVGNAGDDDLSGGAGDDVIEAGAGDDDVYGGDGDDELHGGAGDDNVNGGSGNDTIHGNGGADLLDGGSGDDTIYGGDGDDVINGGAGSDEIHAGSGNDTVNDMATADTINTDAGDDTVNLFPGSVISGEAQSIDGGDGDDRINVGDNGSSTAFDVDISDGSVANVETVALDTAFTYPTVDGNTLTADGDDEVTFVVNATAFSSNATIVADDGDTDDTFVAEGNDGAGDTIDLAGLTFEDTVGDPFEGSVVIDGLGGDDTLTAPELEEASVTVNGGDGDDTLTGSSADGDVLNGEDGDDTLNAGDGGTTDTGDTLNGGSGDDTLNGGADDDTLDGGAGEDTINAGGGDDIILDSASADEINGEDGDDTLRLTAEAAILSGEAQVMDGGNGTGDTIEVAMSASGTEEVYFTQSTVRNFETIDIQQGDDTVLIGSGTTIESDPDVIGSGNLEGDTTAGDDTVDLSNVSLGSIGGSVDYLLEGGSGDDTITGTGLADGNGGVLGTSGTASFTGGSGDDTLSGAGGDDIIEGNAGNDTINGGTGADELMGHTGDDTLTGGAGNDALYGGDGVDTVSGGSGNDAIFGDAGNDILSTGAGTDTVTGGTGADEIDLGANADTVNYRDINPDADPADDPAATDSDTTNDRFHAENTALANETFAVGSVDRISNFDQNADSIQFDNGSTYAGTALDVDSQGFNYTSDTTEEANGAFTNSNGIHHIDLNDGATTGETTLDDGAGPDELLDFNAVIDEIEKAVGDTTPGDNQAQLGGSAIDHMVFTIFDDGGDGAGDANDSLGIYEYVEGSANNDTIDGGELSLIGLASGGDAAAEFDAF